jgi:uncharacterized protein (TIGR00369 family)
MDFSQLLDAEPFLGYLGMEIVEAKVSDVVLRLPLRRELTNHAGMIHGGAQYCLGEATAATLACVMFSEELGRVNVLTAHAAITYRHPSQGDLTARTAYTGEEHERIRAEFAAQGRVRFTTNVELTDASGEVVTTLVVECAVLARR